MINGFLSYHLLSPSPSHHDFYGCYINPASPNGSCLWHWASHIGMIGVIMDYENNPGFAVYRWLNPNDCPRMLVSKLNPPLLHATQATHFASPSFNRRWITCRPSPWAELQIGTKASTNNLRGLNCKYGKNGHNFVLTLYIMENIWKNHMNHGQMIWLYCVSHLSDCYIDNILEGFDTFHRREAGAHFYPFGMLSMQTPYSRTHDTSRFESGRNLFHCGDHSFLDWWP